MHGRISGAILIIGAPVIINERIGISIEAIIPEVIPLYITIKIRIKLINAPDRATFKPAISKGFLIKKITTILSASIIAVKVICLVLSFNV